MNTNEWVNNRELHGQMTFSLLEISSEFSSVSPKGLKTEIARMVSRGRIQSVFRGFYVIVPVQYRLKGVIPPIYYIDELMQYLGRPYYVGLLSAAAMYGAGHQRAMQTQVVTIPPQLNVSGRNVLIDWNYRATIPQNQLMTKNGEMGIIHYSSPELTAIDLIQFANHIGGYQRAATVLAELVENLDIQKIVAIVPYTTIPTIQRMGYILEYVLEEREKADELFSILKTKRHWNTVLLNPQMPNMDDAPSNRWHINANTDIEIDEL